MPDSINCREIERAICSHYESHKWLMPTTTPPGWWECDMFSLTQSDYMNEFEIKTSRSDFFADFKKNVDGWAAVRMRGKNPYGLKQGEYDALSRPILKHQLLSEGFERGPSRFWFCTPTRLVRPREIPCYAGHLEFYKRGKTHIRTIVRKKAPFLHREKFSEKRLKVLVGRIYWRYRQLYFFDLPKLHERIELINDDT